MSRQIVCATRAGEHSRIVHTRAFETAAEQEAELVFVHVLGSEFAEQPDSMQRAIREEVGWLVRALVHMAQQRSNASQVEIAIEIREGDVISEIVNAVADHQASILVMGHPGYGGVTTFDAAMLDDLTTRLAALGASAMLVEL